MGFGVMNEIMMIMYSMQVAFSVLGIAMLSYFSKKLPREFVKLGKIANCLGCLMKICFKLVFLLSWVSMVIILIQGI